MKLELHKLKLDDVFLIKTSLFVDKRGSFIESFSEKINQSLGVNIKWIQDNESVSKKYVFRGLHFQKDEYAQSKLVRVSNGKIIDILLDLRKNSSTFMNFIKVNLNHRNLLLYVPKGIAHGFISLDDNTIVNYKCDNSYNPDYESGVNPFKSNLKINLGVDKKKIIVSKKDLSLPSIDNCYVF